MRPVSIIIDSMISPLLRSCTRQEKRGAGRWLPPVTYFTLYLSLPYDSLAGGAQALVVLPDGLDELLAFARVVDGLDTGHSALDALLVVHLKY